jgi:hypothetical protein
MCGCKRHGDKDASCTCICPEHRNFDAAYDLAMRRYDEIRELRARFDEAQREALYAARDALYRGEGPDMFEDSDIVYGEWLSNRADAIEPTS